MVAEPTIICPSVQPFSQKLVCCEIVSQEGCVTSGTQVKVQVAMTFGRVSEVGGVPKKLLLSMVT